jgi:hypothetical protein
VIDRQGRRFAKQRQRDAAIARKRWIVREERLAVGAASDFVNAFAGNVLGREDAARRIGAGC